MAYRDFKISDIKQKFSLNQSSRKLFREVKLVEPSLLLLQVLERNQLMRRTTEKAVSEHIISPILSEVQVNNADKITLFSGEILTADKKLGLNGELDFLFIREAHAFEIYAPIINVTEAKLDKALDKSVGQAAAQMIGARLFNKNNKSPIETIFGAVTNGEVWLFIQLENDTIWIDDDRYYLHELPKLLGVFQKIVDFYY